MAMPFVQLVKELTLNPETAFEKLKGERDSHDLPYFMKLVIIHALLSAVLSTGSGSPVLRLLGFEPTMENLIGLFVGLFIITIIVMWVAVLIAALWFHIFVYLSHGRQGIRETIRAVLYGSTPMLVIGWIPLIGFIGGLYSLYLYKLGAQAFHGMTPELALRALILYIVSFVIITVILAMFIAATIFGLFG